ncbi:ABC transporter ATP-binding protein [Streptomyces sp. NPDC002623]
MAEGDLARDTGAESGRSVLEVDRLAKVYAASRSSATGTEAIAGLTFSAARGEFVVLVGPSGCGKTTLLRCLAGLDRPSSGAIRLDGRAVHGVQHSLAVVFQEYTRSLFPWLSVRRNVEFGLHALPRRERAARVADSLGHVGLTEFADHYPWQLSGGMQQRVAIARAIASRPSYLLMDEPFASVDAQTRAQLESMVLDLWREFGWTVLLVTHDIDEAIFMADRVLVLSRRPSRVLRTVTVDLDRPRDQVETRALPEFQQYRKEIFGLIGTAG